MTHERSIMGIPCTARRHYSTKESPLLQKSLTHSLCNLRKGPREACKFHKSPESYKILINFSNLRTFLFLVKELFESKGNSYRTLCNVGLLIYSATSLSNPGLLLATCVNEAEDFWKVANATMQRCLLLSQCYTTAIYDTVYVCFQYTLES